MAVTRSGHYCLVPYLTREDDTCTVIYGTALPFILRSAGGPRYYKVVGDAFVASSRDFDWEAGELPHRWSRGDCANQDWLDWGLEEEDIWLC